MKTTTLRRRIIPVAITTAIIASAVVMIHGRLIGQPALAQDASAGAKQEIVPPGEYVSKDGSIRLPEGYRSKWTHLGSWYVEEGQAGSGNMHNVYAEPNAVAEYRKTGKWPQGATIVKEVRATTKGDMTTGTARWDGPMVLWFVMVRDNNHTFPNNPNWGRDWGWALFHIEDPRKQVSTDYKVDCLGCHLPAEKTNWIYEKNYPLLTEKDGPFKAYPKEMYDNYAKPAK
jgi:hypothetical protein